MPAIYVDLDDVLAKTTCHYVDVLKREFGKTVDFESITSFNLQKTFSLSDSEFEYFFKLVHEPEIILKLEPIEGAMSVQRCVTWEDIEKATRDNELGTV